MFCPTDGKVLTLQKIETSPVEEVTRYYSCTECNTVWAVIYDIYYQETTIHLENKGD